MRIRPNMSHAAADARHAIKKKKARTIIWPFPLPCGAPMSNNPCGSSSRHRSRPNWRLRVADNPSLPLLLIGLETAIVLHVLAHILVVRFCVSAIYLWFLGRRGP